MVFINISFKISDKITLKEKQLDIGMKSVINGNSTRILIPKKKL